MRFKHILFDLDGTLTDSREGITSTICRVLRDFGKTEVIPADLTWCIGPPLRDSLAELLGDAGELADRALARYETYYRGGGMYVNRVYEGVPEALGTLCRLGRRLSVVTGKPIDQAQPILDHFGLGGFFDRVFGPTPKHRSEDKGLLLSSALKGLGVRGEECLYIGDRAGDVLGARKNSIPCMGVGYGYGSRSELETAGARVIVSSPEDWREGIACMEAGASGVSEA